MRREPSYTESANCEALYGKDGAGRGHQLNITAEIDLTLQLDCKCIRVPVFVQPDSSQMCLLGMNAIPLLGIRVICADGKVLCGELEQARDSSPELIMVSLSETAEVLEPPTCSEGQSSYGSHHSQ